MNQGMARPVSMGRLLLEHLRLPFQVLLGPIFLLGAWSAGNPRLSWLPPFLLVHVGLYGGATAYNSFYDRDHGPIGFLKHPRPVTRAVRNLSLLLQGAAVVWLAVTAPPAGVIALAMMAMGIAYSHPRWRWKGSTWGGLAAVALGQGIGAVYLGCFATSGHPSSTTHLAALGAALVTLGLYPITQVYQIEEDRERGDVTVPVRLGWRRSFLFSSVFITLGLWVLALVVRRRAASPWPEVLAASPALFLLALAFWARVFDRQLPEQNHDWALGLGSAASLFFWILLLGPLR